MGCFGWCRLLLCIVSSIGLCLAAIAVSYCLGGVVTVHCELHWAVSGSYCCQLLLGWCRFLLCIVSSIGLCLAAIAVSYCLGGVVFYCAL